MRKSDLSSPVLISRSEWQDMFPEHVRLRAVAALMGEARDQGVAGMRAVGEVIHNRSMLAISGEAERVGYGSWGKTPESVMAARLQFSCFNKDDPFYQKAQDIMAGKDPWEIFGNKKEVDLFYQAVNIVDDLAAGKLSNDHGADHYHANYVRPDWRSSKRLTHSEGTHRFYKLIPGDPNDLKVVEDSDPRYQESLAKAGGPSVEFSLVAALERNIKDDPGQKVVADIAIPPLPVLRGEEKAVVRNDQKPVESNDEIVIGVRGNLTKTMQKAASQFGIDMSIKEAYKVAVQYAENHGFDANRVQKGQQLSFERDDFRLS